MVISDSFSENLKQLRKVRGDTLEEVAKATGVSSTCILYYERGEREPLVKNVIALARYFGVDVNLLLGIGYTKDQTLQLKDKLNLLTEQQRKAVEFLVDSYLNG